MKYHSNLKLMTVLVICLAALVSIAQAQETDDSDKNIKGQAQFRYDWIGVSKDRGRFREDNWMTDRSSGGLDWLHLESKEADKYGYEWLIEGNALYDYDYDLLAVLEKIDSHYLKVDFSSDRRYFDGSNEYWRPSGIDMAELSDFDYYTDRRNYNVELGLTPPEGAEWIFGWNRMVKDGKEVMLLGGNASDDGLHSIPTILDVRGITDTFYAEVAQTFAEKYNFRIRQEWEQYRSNRLTDWQYRDSSGARTGTSGDINNDHLGYTNWRTMFMFDSFLDEKNYVTANYMYNYLNSNSQYNNVIAAGGGWPHDYKTVAGGISRRTNVSGLGWRKADAFGVEKLVLSTGIRIEDSRTSGYSSYITAADPINPVKTQSQLDEVGVAESIRLVYKGVKNTTLSFDADLEQKDLDWYGDYSGSANNLDRKADTDFTDQIYTFKAVHRFNRAVKSTAKFRFKDLERSVTNRFRGNAVPDDYPGWLGSYRRTGNDITLKTDIRFNPLTNATLLYQFVQESIDFSLGGKTSNIEIHRGASSISFNPKPNLFFVGTAMLENYDLDTPVDDPDEPGSTPYDYRGTSYSLMLDGTYAFNAKTSCTLGFQHTEALGTVDQTGDYAFDKVGLTLNHKLADNKNISLGYQFYNYNNHDRGSFDDYKAHGASVVYSYSF